MPVIGAVAVQRLRARWRAWSALILLTGLAGGAVLAAAAGARRTDSAFPRFLRATAAADAVVSPAGSGVGGFDFAVAKLPGVRAIGPIVGINAQPLAADGAMDEAAEVVAPLDGRMGHLLERTRLLAGRQPRPDRPDEVMVDQTAAARLGVHVGSALRLGAISNDTGKVHRLTVRVVGIEVIADSIVPVNALAQAAYIQATLALYRQLGPAYQAFDGAFVQLAPGTTVAAFTKEASNLAREPSYSKSTGGQLFVADQSVQDATVERSIRPQAIALAIFALVLALTAIFVLGQAASRLLHASSVDNPVLSALGLTRRQLFTASLLEVLVSAVVGASLACTVAIAASPLTPIGSARLAELRPGVAVDAAVLVPGFAVVVVLLVALASRTAWRQARILPPATATVLPTTGYGSQVARWLATWGAPVSAVTGVRLALQPARGRAAAPTQGAFVGTALAVAAFMASITFGANLTHLERTPHLYGQNWDAAIDLQFGSIVPQQFGTLVANVPGLRDWTFGLHGTVTLNGQGVIPAIALARGRGPLLTPTMLAGHAPASGQIVLGSLSMRQGQLNLGQKIDVLTSAGPERATVAGRAIFPYFGQGSFTPTDLGLGALVPVRMLAAQARANGSAYNFVLLRFAPGPQKAADVAAFKRATAKFCAVQQQTTCVVVNQQPNGLIDYARIDATPLVLAGLLALLGLGVLAQFTFQSARACRRDFAVLKTLGLGRRQLAAVTFWQISTLTTIALAIGLPAGAAAGHWAWALFADVLGISPGTAIPVGTGLLLIPCALLAANLVAAWPAIGPTRLNAAQLLRAE